MCDARAYAGERSPDLLLAFATLTGAARIALGPDLPALFANDDAVANDWIAAGERMRDPVWRMPLWRPYLRYLTSHVADLANAGSRLAGAVTAALYLARFVPRGPVLPVACGRLSSRRTRRPTARSGLGGNRPAGPRPGSRRTATKR